MKNKKLIDLIRLNSLSPTHLRKVAAYSNQSKMLSFKKKSEYRFIRTYVNFYHIPFIIIRASNVFINKVGPTGYHTNGIRAVVTLDTNCNSIRCRSLSVARPRAANTFAITVASSTTRNYFKN